MDGSVYSSLLKLIDKITTNISYCDLCDFLDRNGLSPYLASQNM